MDNNNFLLAILISVLILIGFQYFYFAPQQQHLQQRMVAERAIQNAKPADGYTPPSVLRPRTLVIKDGPRLPVVTPDLRGSINLVGARIDDMQLANYRETVDPNSPPVTLLSPSGSEAPYNSYYAEFGWLADNSATSVPTAQTQWNTTAKKLENGRPVKLTWDNGHGLVFERTISVDDQYMFTITDTVHNTGTSPATLYPFGLVERQGNPVKRSSNILFEGPLAVLDGTLHEYTYKELMDDIKKVDRSKGGWLGITDKYWLVAMIPPQSEQLKANFTYDATGQTDPTLGYFQTDFHGAAVTIIPGGTVENSTRLFVGAKHQAVLEQYRKQYNIPLFDYAIDFGKFWFLTRPFLHLLDFLTRSLGSFALAILVFTVMLKLLTLPLSLKSNHSMSKMRKLQPEIQRLKERFQDDKVRQSQEIMELYKREGVSPLAGCVPTLIQIPIFFALYKVIYIGIEMRQAPFYGWISDMSSPDPSSVFSLGGLVTWTVPAILQIGFWPLLMGCSMFMQQRLSPQPPDKSQARMFMFMPLIFTYMLRNMPAGLVIYWTWSNLLSTLQQWYIMREDLSRKSKS